MRIGIDVSQTGTAKAGCGFFADGLVRELADKDRENAYILYPAFGDLFWDPDCATATFNCDRANFSRMDPPSDFESSRRFWRNPGADFESRLGSPDIVHANNFYCPEGLTNAALVYTLYDLSFLEEPAWTTEENRVGCFNGVFRASSNADFIVAISEHSRRHFLTMFPHFPPERMAIVHPASRFQGTQEVPRPARFGHLEPGRFWLTVGTIEPRKNYIRLLEAFRILNGQASESFPLVLAGGKGWLAEDFPTHMRDLESSLFLPGYISDTELAWLYENCFAFVYPSLFEGFGMPVLEALSFGAAVLCSNTSSLPEVGGDAAVYFDPLDARGIADAMRRLATGEVDRTKLKAAGRTQAKRFSWEISGARLKEVYGEVSQLPRRRASVSAVGR